MATIRLLVSYDQAINNDRSGRYTLPGTITSVAADATRIFTNSQANIQLQVVGTLFLNINDTASNNLRNLFINGFGDLKTLRQRNTNNFYPEDALNALDLLIAERERVKADIVVHWRGPASPAGTAREVGATRDDAFVCVSDSAMDGFTLAHELGHIFGLHHNDAWYSVFRENTAAYTTVMAGGNAVDNSLTSENNKLRINYFSNPNVTTQLPNGQTAKIGLEYVFDSVSKLNFNAPIVAQYGDNLSLPYAPVDELTTIKDVSLGDKGEMWALDSTGCPWRWAWGDVRWKRAPLAAGEVGTQIAVGNPNAVWCLLSDTRLKQFVNGAWIEPNRIARARQIAVGKDGYAVHLAAQPDTYYDNRSSPDWQSVDSTNIGSKLAVQQRNIFWIIRASDNRIMKFDQTRAPTWTTPNPTMQAKDISVGMDGTLGIITEQGQLAISKDGGVSWNFPTQPSLPVTYPNNEFNLRTDAVKISVVDVIRAVKLTSDGKLWKKVTTEGDWVDLTWKYRSDIDID